MSEVEPLARVLIFGGHFLPGYKAGGPVRSLKAVLDSTDPSTSCDVVVYDRDLGDEVAYAGLGGQVVRYGPHLLFYMNVRSPRDWMTLSRRVLGRRYDLVMLHSLWEISFAVVPMLAVVVRAVATKAVMLAPHGQLSEGAMAMKGLSKRALILLWRRLVRQVPFLWHSTAAHERDDILRFFPAAEVITTTGGMGPEHADDVRPSLAGTPCFIFLSRISPMKNLDVVLSSLALSQEALVLDVYGPVGDAGYWARCQGIIDTLPGHVSVRYHGPVEPSEAQALFASHDAFLLPTQGENFGHAIAESLSVGCPVVCSVNTTWTEVLVRGGGSAVADLSPQSYAAAVKEYAVGDPSQRTRRKFSALEAYKEWVGSHAEPNIITEALRTLA